eukprot:6492459-Amphidinium_carterae.1
MSSDSVEAFKLRVAGLPEELRTRLREAQIDTMSALAYRSKGKHGDISGETFESSILEPLAGTRDGPHAAHIRKLYLECWTKVVSELRQANDPAQPSSHALPENEITTRLLKIAGEMPGIDVSDEWEPSSRLINRLHAGVKQLQLPYVAWNSCTSRSEEVHNLSKAPLSHDAFQWMPDAFGAIRERAPHRELHTDLSTDFRVYLALHRRGVALEVAGVMKFVTHRKLVNALFRAYLQQQPAGREKVNLAQLQSTDEFIWTELAKFTRQGLTSTGATTFPCDEELVRILTMSNVELRLQPFRSSQPASSGLSATHPRPDAVNDRPVKAQKVDVKGKGKAATSSNKPPSSFPEELKGQCWRTASGQPLCFAYQLGKCTSKDKDGVRCSRGWHLCAYRTSSGAACGQTHPFCRHST